MTMEEKVFAGFYLEKLYFIPHFEPVIQELRKRGLSYTVIIPSNLDRDEVDQRHEAVAYCRERNLVYCLREDCPAVEYLVFANGRRELGISYQKSVLIFHGTWGGKSVYLDPGLNEVDIRFIDGRFYEDILNEYFPEKKCELCVTGYSKLDAYFDFKEEDKTGLLKRCGLDPCKKTILYAPTFYPSSILKIGSDFPVVLKDYNIIVKPHSNIFLRSKYRHTLKHIRKWGKHENVFIAGFGETNILPFMYAADLMISDISSAVYEFAGLGKPVVVNMFLHYRWYHLLMKKKIGKRLDKAHFYLWNVGDVVDNYREMLDACRTNLMYPEKHQKYREELVKYVLGEVDGKVAVRIVDKLLRERRS